MKTQKVCRHGCKFFDPCSPVWWLVPKRRKRKHASCLSHRSLLLSSEKGLCVRLDEPLARFDDSSAIGVIGGCSALRVDVWRSTVGRDGEDSIVELSEKGLCSDVGVSWMSVASELRRRVRRAREWSSSSSDSESESESNSAACRARE